MYKVIYSCAIHIYLYTYILYIYVYVYTHICICKHKKQQRQKSYLIFIINPFLLPPPPRLYKDHSKRLRDMEVQRRRLEGDLMNRSLKVRDKEHYLSLPLIFLHYLLNLHSFVPLCTPLFFSSSILLTPLLFLSSSLLISPLLFFSSSHLFSSRIFFLILTLLFSSHFF